MVLPPKTIFQNIEFKNLDSVEGCRCHFFENWLIKHKWVTLMTMQQEMYHQNSQFFYPSEPFKKTYHYETPCSTLQFRPAVQAGPAKVGRRRKREAI